MILIALLSVSSCGKEAEYGACFMPDEMKAECKQLNLDGQCKDLGVKCKASCMIGYHPECHNNSCLLYNYEDTATGKLIMSPAFCSKECTADDPAKPTISATCGANALCMPFLDKYYCVPVEYVQKK